VPIISKFEFIPWNDSKIQTFRSLALELGSVNECTTEWNSAS
jgi:hypothetical protein